MMLLDALIQLKERSGRRRSAACQKGFVVPIPEYERKHLSVSSRRSPRWNQPGKKIVIRPLWITVIRDLVVDGAPYNMRRLSLTC